MKNFNNSWRNFLNESSRTENVPFEDTRIHIKLENKQNLLREVTTDEFEHIQRAIDELSYEQLAFHGIFGDKTRLIIDFPTPDRSTPLGRFISMWVEMGYDVDWKKGIVSGDRKFRDSSPAGNAASILDRGVGTAQKNKKINMKIGKWLAKLFTLVLKHSRYKEQVKEYVLTRATTRFGDLRGDPRITGVDIEAALGEDDATNYYRLGDTIDMMMRPLRHPDHGSGSATNQQLKTPEYLTSLITYWRDNAADIKNNITEATSNLYSIIITRDPVDVWRMADFDSMSSCHSPPSRGGGGEYYKCAVAEAHGHGAVAYIVKTEELLENTAAKTIEEAENDIQQGEVFGDDARFGGAGFDIMPHARVRLRQVRYYEAGVKAAHPSDVNPFTGTQLAIPERRVYGASIPGFRERVVQWARETQQTEMQQAPKVDDGAKLNLNDFIAFGGSYGDHPISLLITYLFGDEIKGSEGAVQRDTETEDTLDVDLVGGLIERYQIESDAVTLEWNNRMGWTKVDATATDDGGDGAYIAIEARMYVGWAADEWSRMPGVDIIGHGLEEVKEYGMGWADADYPFVIEKKNNGDSWILPITVLAARLAGFGAQEYAYAPEDYDTFCSIVNDEVDDKHEAVKNILTNFFKREGYMEGGAVMNLGREVTNDDMDLYHWESEAEEGYDMDEYEIIQFTAHPEVWWKALGATEEQAGKIMNDRNFWLEIRRRMAAPAFENTGGAMYPQMPLDMDLFGVHGTEDESQELNLYFSIHEDAPDEQAKVLRNLVEIWDDQEEIDRVVSEVFRDMLAGSVGLDGTPVGDLPGDSSVSESNKREELNALKIERMLTRLNG
jgi:hypothetical protein